MEDTGNKSIEIHYQKNPMYRTVYCDGAFGGVTPVNQVNLIFYATRAAIPKSIKYAIDDENRLKDEFEISSDSKAGIVREIEFGVYMNRQTAKEVYEFLKNIFDEQSK